MTENGCRKRE